MGEVKYDWNVIENENNMLGPKMYLDKRFLSKFSAL